MPFALKEKNLAQWRVWLLVCTMSPRTVIWPQLLGLFKEGLGFGMNGNICDHVDEHRAAVLLGMPRSELRRYSRASGLGHLENDEKGQKVVFTYEELRRICLLMAQSSK